MKVHSMLIGFIKAMEKVDLVMDLMAKVQLKVE